MSRIGLLVVLSVALLLISSCGLDRGNPMSPTRSLSAHAVTPQSLASDAKPAPGLESADGAGQIAGSGFFPLTLGNHWEYVTGLSGTITDESGQSTPFSDPGTMSASLTSVRSFYGRDYVEETMEFATSGSATVASFIEFRQDRSGLYEADVSVTAARGIAGRSPESDASIPPRDARAAILRAACGPRVSDASIARALDRLDHAIGAGYAASAGARPGGALDHEITRLSYPLHPGVHWLIRDDPRFESTVEAIGPVRVPAGRFVAARIRINSEFFGPNDVVHVWYGRQGFIKLAAHVESVVIDNNGSPVGMMVADETQDLTSLDLLDRHGHDPEHGALSPASATEP